ncbi:MAG: 4Fe-4S binding protein [Candidatus Rokubacteria bacterium]|nr:4Fe-4S binding protein [Candidatus Rokubacteria bacterium]
MRAEVLIEEARCRSCGICIDVCPTQVLVPMPITKKAAVGKIEKCTACRLCEVLCPDWAVTVYAAHEEAAHV